MGTQPGPSRAGPGRPAGPGWPGPRLRDKPIDVRPDGSRSELQLADCQGDTVASTRQPPPRCATGAPRNNRISREKTVDVTGIHAWSPVHGHVGDPAGIVPRGSPPVNHQSVTRSQWSLARSPFAHWMWQFRRSAGSPSGFRRKDVVDPRRFRPDSPTALKLVDPSACRSGTPVAGYPTLMERLP